MRYELLNSVHLDASPSSQAHPSSSHLDSTFFRFMANHRAKVNGRELVVIYTPASERSIVLSPGQILCQKVSGGLASSNVRIHCYKDNAVHQKQLRPLPLETHTTARRSPLAIRLTLTTS